MAEMYRYGGGRAGNVGARTINAPLTNLTGIESVTNERRAVGGADEERFEDFKECAPAKLRNRDRAVSAEDFATLAQQVGGIASAIALPHFHPDHRGVAVPGSVTVVVVPDSEGVPPKPTPEQLEAVCRYLDERRLLTTELHVKGPEYTAIKVITHVAVDPYASFGEVQEAVNAAINTYLNPLGQIVKVQQANGQADSANAGGQATAATTGGKAAATPGSGQAAVGAGSRFGQDLYPSNLLSVIRGVDRVWAVTYLALTVDGVPHGDPGQPIVTNPVVIKNRDQMVYGVPRHDIVVEPYRDQ